MHSQSPTLYQKALPYLLALIAVIIWGFNYLAAKVAVTGLPPFLTLSLRFFFVCLILLPFYPKPPIPIKQILLISLSFGLGHLGLMFLSLHMGLSSSVAIVVNQMGVPFAILLAYFLFQERPSVTKIIGIGFAIMGTFFLAQTSNSVNNPLAFAFILLGSFFWAVYTVQLKKFNSKSPLGLVAWISLFSFFIALSLSLLVEDNQLAKIQNASFANWLGLLYTVIFASIIAHGIWGHLMTTHNVNKTISMTLLIPFFGVFGGVFFLEEELSKSMIIGAMIMFAGLKITLIRRRRV